MAQYKLSHDYMVNIKYYFESLVFYQQYVKLIYSLNHQKDNIEAENDFHPQFQ